MFQRWRQNLYYIFEYLKLQKYQIDEFSCQKSNFHPKLNLQNIEKWANFDQL